MERIAKQLRRSFDWYVAIARGGMVPACLLAQITGQERIDTICLNSYGDGQEQQQLTIWDKAFFHVAGCSVLLIDDLVDTGHTMRAAMNLMVAAGAKSIQTAVIYRKANSLFQPDYFIEEKPRDEWIVFPWEKNQTI